MTHSITLQGTDTAFPCDAGQTVLDAATQAGVELPYSCRKGVCGNCAGRVLNGSVHAAPGLPLRNDTCADGQVLLCAAVPGSDLVIAPTAWRRASPQLRRRFTAKVYRRRQAAGDVSILQLRLPPAQRAKFRAGQYLQLRLPDGSERSYSMANAPHDSNVLTLHIRHVDGGRFSALLPSLQPGQPVEVELPYGTFSLADADDPQQPVVCVAGGTGFAPMQSIIDDMVRRGIRRPLTLFWGVRRPHDLYLLAAVDRWQRQLPGFRFIAAISDAQPGDVLPAGAFNGMVHDALAAHCSTLAGHALYVCGAPPMVAAVRRVAQQQLGLAPADFHADVFVTAAPPTAPA